MIKFFCNKCDVLLPKDGIHEVLVRHDRKTYNIDNPIKTKHHNWHLCDKCLNQLLVFATIEPEQI